MRTLLAILPLVALLAWLNPAPMALSGPASLAGMKTSPGFNPMEQSIEQEVARLRTTTQANADNLGHALLDSLTVTPSPRTSATLEAAVIR
ncbi:MAG: hypothetical protein RI907_291 [Pseudomonadota bacterium]|jgi:hypothetical protein